MPQSSIGLAEPRIFTFDPGYTTGYAEFSLNGRLIAWGSFPGYEGFETRLREGAEYKFLPNDVVVYEKVTATAASFRDDGVRAIGVIEYLCYRSKITPIVQQPSILKNMYTLVDLSRVVNGDVHSLEAILHGMYYLAKKRVVTLPCAVKFLDDL